MVAEEFTEEANFTDGLVGNVVATPIGYQTNTYVYNIGNYRFGDFLRVGVPMNLLMLAVAVTVIPLLWPL